MICLGVAMRYLEPTRLQVVIIYICIQRKILIYQDREVTTAPTGIYRRSQFDLLLSHWAEIEALFSISLLTNIIPCDTAIANNFSVSRRHVVNFTAIYYYKSVQFMPSLS